MLYFRCVCMYVWILWGGDPFKSMQPKSREPGFGSGTSGHVGMNELNPYMGETVYDQHEGEDLGGDYQGDMESYGKYPCMMLIVELIVVERT